MRSQGLIPVLRRALIKLYARNKTQKAVLCYEKTVHIRRQLWDASWGCGYRNYLMACTALMEQPFEPTYLSLLDDDSSPPCIRNLQRDLEAAWKEGYDKIGARDLSHSLVGTSKWIGTAELYTAFTRRRIPWALTAHVFVSWGTHNADAFRLVANWSISISTNDPKVPNQSLIGSLNIFPHRYPKWKYLSTTECRRWYRQTKCQLFYSTRAIRGRSLGMKYRGRGRSICSFLIQDGQFSFISVNDEEKTNFGMLK